MFEQILHMNIHNKPLSAWLDAVLFTEFTINSTIIQSAGCSPFFTLYGQEVPLPFYHALANPSDGTLQPATTNSSKNAAQIQPHDYTQQIHLNLQKQFKITCKMQKNKCKKHSNTKKLIMFQNTIHYNSK